MDHTEHFRRYFLGRRRPPRRYCDCAGRLTPHTRGATGCTWAEPPAESELWCTCHGMPEHRHEPDGALKLRRLPTLEEHAAIHRYHRLGAAQRIPELQRAQTRADEQLAEDATRALLAALIGDNLGGAIARLWKAGQTSDTVLALNELAAARHLIGREMRRRTGWQERDADGKTEIEY